MQLKLLFHGVQVRRSGEFAPGIVAGLPLGIGANDGIGCALRAIACRQPVKQRNRLRIEVSCQLLAMQAGHERGRTSHPLSR
jgi:hypothetical protein